jgi:repressor LexA
MAELTEIQQRVFDFIRRRLLNGYSAPSLREVASEFGWASKRAAERHVHALTKKGWLTSDPGKARSLRLAKSPTIVEIPLFGTIPAGFGQDREQADECVPVTIESIDFKPTRNTFALRVVGDSMIGKHICSGDIAVFEHGPDPRSGEIVAALIDRKSTLKTYVVKNGRPHLKAENPRYPDLIPADELVIQGVFRALIRRPRE